MRNTSTGSRGVRNAKYDFPFLPWPERKEIAEVPKQVRGMSIILAKSGENWPDTGNKCMGNALGTSCNSGATVLRTEFSYFRSSFTTIALALSHMAASIKALGCAEHLAFQKMPNATGVFAYIVLRAAQCTTLLSSSILVHCNTGFLSLF